MAFYQTQTVSSVADLVSKLNAFLTTGGAGNPGWTADDHTPANGTWAISKDDGLGQSVEVAFQWDTLSPNALGIYQYHTGLGAGNYNSGGGTVPYDQDGDSGNGAASTGDTNLLLARHVPLTSTPEQYWAFTGDTFVHIVVRVATLDYVHFGFGVMDKFNDWTGGEYAYGYRFSGGINNTVALQSGSTALLDGLLTNSTLANAELYSATIRTEGFTDSPTGGLWAVHMGSQASGSLGNDRQSTPRGRIHLVGGFRAGPQAVMFGQFAGSITNSLIPAYPLVHYHWNRTTGRFAVIGQMKEIRGILMTNFTAEDTVVIGSDTWHIFPSRRLYSGSGSLTNTSGYQGIMYKEN